MGTSVALIDDDLSVRRALPRLLRTAGYETRAFVSAQELLDSGFARCAACLVIDLHLHGMNGLDLLHHLRSQGTRTPAVLITALEDGDSRERARRLEVSAFLRKPFEGSAFLDAVARAIAEGPVPAGDPAGPEH